MRQELEGRIDLAGEIYAHLASDTASDSAGNRARERLALLRGQGSVGARIELLSRHFAQQASDPALLGGMLIGGAVFQSLRLATLSRLAASPTASLFTRGLGARTLSWGAAFAFEVPAFTLATRGLHEALGREQDWSWGGLGRELLSAGITLFLLKSSGSAAATLSRRIATQGTSANFLSRFSARALPQAAAFTGIFSAHALEARLGLRAPLDPANAIVESLATLLQFHVSGRMIRFASDGAYERRIAAITHQLQTEAPLPPPRLPGLPGTMTVGFRPVTAISGEVPGLAPDIVFMTNNQSGQRPSSRPGALVAESEGSPGGKIVAHPAQLRDLKTELDNLEHTLLSGYRGEFPGSSWGREVEQLSSELNAIVEELHYRIGQEPSRAEILPYVRELNLEYRTIRQLLERARLAERQIPPSDALDMHRFFTHYYRSTNTLINFLNHSAFIQQPIEEARRARSWLQRGLEGEKAEDNEVSTIHPHSPYERLPDGSFRLLPPHLKILLIGDEHAPRTFQLAEMGHRVTHLNEDLGVLRSTERRLQMRTQRKRESGEYSFDFNPAVDFRGDPEEVPPADLIEAFFPKNLAELAPRSTPQRHETLQAFLQRQLKDRLAPGGSAFVLADRDEAVEDLANLVLQDPHLELLELRQRRTRLPLMGGAAVTIESGEAMVSWLLFRRLP